MKKFNPVKLEEFKEVLKENITDLFIGRPLTPYNLSCIRIKIQKLLDTIVSATFDEIHMHFKPRESHISFRLVPECQDLIIVPENLYTACLMGLGEDQMLKLGEI